MSTLYFTNSEVIILRTRQKGSSDRYGMSATYTAIAADIQPDSPERIQMLGGRPGHSYTGFISTDFLIKEGDRLVVIDNNQRTKKYEVRGVNYWQGAGLLDHQELTLTSEVA